MRNIVLNANLVDICQFVDFQHFIFVIIVLKIVQWLVGVVFFS